jgi:hypothetical protein
MNIYIFFSSQTFLHSSNILWLPRKNPIWRLPNLKQGRLKEWLVFKNKEPKNQKLWRSTFKTNRLKQRLSLKLFRWTLTSRPYSLKSSRMTCRAGTFLYQITSITSNYNKEIFYNKKKLKEV